MKEKPTIIIVFFLTFLGYYIVLLGLFNLGLPQISRFVTIPLRIIVVFLLLYIVIRFHNSVKQEKAYTIAFLTFSTLYFGRIIYDAIRHKEYYLTTEEITFYFLSFCVIPFYCIIKINFDNKRIEWIANTMFFSSVVFSVSAIISLEKYIGQVSRLTSSAANEEVISPLALSYSSSFVIGFLISYLYGNNVSRIYKLAGIFTIICATIPFFLGSSRGGIFALIIPLSLMYFNPDRKTKSIFILLLVILSISGVLVAIDGLLSSGLIDRFLNTSKDIEEGNSSAIRTTIWRSSLNQFTSNPLFGDSLRVNNWNGYPHNIFIEIFQTLGILGMIPFVFIVSKAVVENLRIIRFHKEYFWILNIFLQSFIQQLFSGAIYTGVWFWSSLAMIISLNRFLKLKNITNTTYIEKSYHPL
jgi:O-antigen ligase